MMKLLIVESPAKCKKIAGFLGSGWRVQATMGHIRALKEDLEAIGFRSGAATQDWMPTYESIQTKAAAIAALRKAASGAQVYLGSDDDREGEAIAWHTCALLKLDPATTPRVVFHEITEPALKAAVANPRTIDMNKFNAQQARTMLDLLIGFTLSPCLWRGVGYKPGLSAGRCQTPALRLVYDRDREIEGHTATLSWRITATTDGPIQWQATEASESEEAAAATLTSLAAAKPKAIAVQDRQERVATHQPPKPFITSSLQQEASSRLGMKPKTTMSAAQKLYEAGHITYMRTDNPVLSQEGQDAAEAVVRARWGEEYVGTAATAAEPRKRVVKKKTAPPAGAAPAAQAAHEAAKAATLSDPAVQGAHEAIRPTHMEVDSGASLPDVGRDEQRLYDLIWKRTIQSVMAAEQRDTAILTATPVGLSAPLLKTSWDQTRFAGWRVLDTERNTEAEEAAATTFAARAALQAGIQLPWTVFQATEVRTSAPTRYTEASLIRELEHRGIGRPSTYAALVETVLDREYVEKATIPATTVQVRGLELKASAKAPKATTRSEKSGAEKEKLRTTALGRTVIEWLQANFDDMIGYDRTAAMESELDEVARGTRPWKSVLTNTWEQYAERYTAIMASPGTKAAAGPGSNSGSNSKKAEYGDGYKMVISKKGPLFVYECEGQPARFASVPAHLSIQTATRADAEAAFQTVAGDSLGTLDDKPVIRKKGPYGYYAVWGDIRCNCSPTDTLEALEEKLRAKAAPPPADAVDHTVGPYRIKRGPYGLYMFRSTGAAVGRKPVFVSIPADTPWATLTPESAEALYKHAAEAKKSATAGRFKKGGKE